MSASEFLKLIREKQELVGLKSELTGWAVNVGFSGGEKKATNFFFKWLF